MKDNKIIEAIIHSKEIYDNIELPDNLNKIVSNTIEKADQTNIVQIKPKKYLMKIISGAAILFICFIFALNSSETFAKEIGKIPILGAISRIFTFQSYEKTDNDKTVKVKIPQINPSENSAKKQILDTNAEIKKRIKEYETDAQNRIIEYKEAFLSTGGTEEEFSEKNILVDISYEIYYESKNWLSFVLKANENWCGAYGINYFYNIDLKTGKNLTLKNILGENYIDIVNKDIKKQMQERMIEDKDLIYWDGSDGIEGFKTIDKNTKFYINKKENPVIVFEKYEIAPGAFGQQEFEIQAK